MIPIGLFDFINDIGTYEQRKVARYDNDNTDLHVSTVRVSDGKQPIETAIMHPDYAGGAPIPVEAYDTVNEALAGHYRWIARMSTEPLPDYLIDIAQTEIGDMIRESGNGGVLMYMRQRKET